MDYKLLIHQLNMTMQVPVSLVDPNGSTICCVPETEHHFLPPDLFCAELDLIGRDKFRPDMPCMRAGGFSTLIGAVQTPEGDYLVVGPSASRHVSLSDVVEEVPDNVSRDDVMALYRVYQQCAVVNAVRFAGTLALINQIIHGIQVQPIDILQANFVLPEERDGAEQQELQQQLVPTSVENMILFESKLRSAICSGNIQELDNIWKTPLSLTLKHLERSMPNELYYTIAYLTVMSRAAIDGGAVAEKTFAIYGRLLSRHRNAGSIAESTQVVVQASYDFCNLVRECAGVDMHSDLCRICEKYVNDHIADKITALDLARACNVDRSDIFDIFRSNFHMSMTEYIQRERLRRAELLMLNTSYTIGQVSAALGFVSQGYFSKVFAKYHNCTPGEYRARNIRN